MPGSGWSCCLAFRGGGPPVMCISPTAKPAPPLPNVHVPSGRIDVVVAPRVVVLLAALGTDALLWLVHPNAAMAARSIPIPRLITDGTVHRRELPFPPFHARTTRLRAGSPLGPGSPVDYRERSFSSMLNDPMLLLPSAMVGTARQPALRSRLLRGCTSCPPHLRRWRCMTGYRGRVAARARGWSTDNVSHS